MFCRHVVVLMATVLAMPASMAAGADAATPIAVDKAIELDVEWISSPKPTIHVDSNTPTTIDTWPEEASASWDIQLSDKTLSTVLARWSQRAGWQLVWDAERDFPIENHIVLAGSYVMVVQTVMDSLNDSDYPLQASLNPATRVIRIAKYLEARRK